MTNQSVHGFEEKQKRCTCNKSSGMGARRQTNCPTAMQLNHASSTESFDARSQAGRRQRRQYHVGVEIEN